MTDYYKIGNKNNSAANKEDFMWHAVPGLKTHLHYRDKAGQAIHAPGFILCTYNRYSCSISNHISGRFGILWIICWCQFYNDNFF
jgi:hypothetical protein